MSKLKEFPRKGRKKKVICDDLVKYQCTDCCNEFIVSDFLTQNQNDFLKSIPLTCPFCGNTNAECVVGPVTDTDFHDLLLSFGCLGIYTEEK